MKTLLKAMESEEDLRRFMSFCEANGIVTIARNGVRITAADIDFENESINWGGYGSRFSVSPALFGYFKLEFPGGPPPRGKSFANVKMVISGKLAKLDLDEVTTKVHAEGGTLVSKLDKSVNLLVLGNKPDAKLVKKAEGLGHVVILDEARFGPLLPAPRKASKKRKPARATPDGVDKKTISNLKKMLVSRDVDRVMQGVELMRSLEDVAIYDYFLAGVTTDVDGNPVPTAVFKGTGPAQPYLNAALLGVISYAPEDCEVAAALKKSVTNLQMELASGETLSAFPNLKALDLSGSKELTNVDGLAEAKKLKSINLSGCESLENVDGLSATTRLSKVDFSGCGSLVNVDGLANNEKISQVDFSGCQSLKNVDGLANCTNLSAADFSYCTQLENVDGLARSTKFKKLSFESCYSLENVDGISGCTKLTALSLEGCSGLTNLDGVSKLKQLKSANFDGCTGLENLDGLKGATSLHDLHLGCDLPRVDGLSGLKSLVELTLYSESAVLESVDALSGCSKLERLELSSGALENVDGLGKCKSLKTLTLDHCDSLLNVDGLAGCKKLDSLSLTSCSALESLDGIKKSTQLTDLKIEGCSSLENLDALKDLAKLKVAGWYPHFDLDGCDGLRDVSGLSGCTKIKTVRMGSSDREELPTGFDQLRSVKTFYFSYLPQLKNVDPLAGCDRVVEIRLNECKSLANVAGLVDCKKLEKLDLKGSNNVKPKPAKLGMSSRSEVAAYLAKVKKEFAPAEAADESAGKASGSKKKASKKKASKKKAKKRR